MDQWEIEHIIVRAIAATGGDNCLRYEAIVWQFDFADVDFDAVADCLGDLVKLGVLLICQDLSDRGRKMARLLAKSPADAPNILRRPEMRGAA